MKNINERAGLNPKALMDLRRTNIAAMQSLPKAETAPGIPVANIIEKLSGGFKRAPKLSPEEVTRIAFELRVPRIVLEEIEARPK